MKTVPNQRIIKIIKSPTDKQHLYTANNLQALFEAMQNLKSLCGFKLYMYFAKNQNNYEFALSSKDFCECAGCSMSAYNTAFEELVEQGYLIQKAGVKTIYTFIDKVSNQEIEIKTIEDPKAENETNNIEYDPCDPRHAYLYF